MVFTLKAKDILTDQIPNWQDKCTDITNVPDSVMSMIDGLRTPVSMTPQASPAINRHSRVGTGKIHETKHVHRYFVVVLILSKLDTYYIILSV